MREEASSGESEEEVEISVKSNSAALESSAFRMEEDDMETSCSTYRMQTAMLPGESEIEEKGDDMPVIIYMSGATSNQFPNTAVPNNNIQDQVEFLLACEEGDNTTDRYSSSISLVPSILRDHSQESFNPRVVSIGPLHHKDKNLKRSEGWKRTCMCDLLERLSFPLEQTLETCLKEVNESISNIKTCYVGAGHYSDKELATIMVMDSCFILEVLSRANEINYFLWVQVCKDLLLVENQIPLFVLHNIFKCTILKSKNSVSFTELIKPVIKFGHLGLFKEGSLRITDALKSITKEDHILSLLHKCYAFNMPQPTLSSTSLPFTCNVVQLAKAGVTFKPHEDKDECWQFAIDIEWSRFAWFSWFWYKPIVKIPVMLIQDDTEMILRNIIAFEQISRVKGYFTSYMSTIDELVDSGHDIAKLVESGIIIFNGLGSNEDAAKMINSLCKNAMTDNYYSKKWEELGNYYNGYWPRSIAWLRTTYFNNPWNSIALIAGIILFALTAIQTYFSIFPKN